MKTIYLANIFYLTAKQGFDNYCTIKSKGNGSGKVDFVPKHSQKIKSKKRK